MGRARSNWRLVAGQYVRVYHVTSYRVHIGVPTRAKYMSYPTPYISPLVLLAPVNVVRLLVGGCLLLPPVGIHHGSSTAQVLS